MLQGSLITSFGTVVYFDDETSALRHGLIENSPRNLVCESDSDGMVLQRVGGDAITATKSGSSLDYRFEVHPLPWNEFGLSRGGVFLSAQPQGDITLDRHECSQWETFHCVEDPHELSGTIITNNVEGHRIKFFITNRRDEIQRYLCRGTFYERLELETIKNHCRPEMTAVDIGANIGNHTVYLAKICNVRNVIPFEPNPLALGSLRVNLALNHCFNVDTRYLGLALGSKRATYKLEDLVGDNLGGARLIQHETGTLRSVTGDELLAMEPIGFIKIDVEGMEFEVLSGLRQTIGDWRPVIFIEVWQEARRKLEQWCKKNRYALSWNRYDNFLLLPR